MRPFRKFSQNYVFQLLRGRPNSFLLLTTGPLVFFWYNTSRCQINDRLRLDLFGPRLREFGTKLFVEMFNVSRKEEDDITSLNYKEKLTNMMIDAFLLDRRLDRETANRQCQRVTLIVERIMKANPNLPAPKVHLTIGKSLQAFSLGHHVVLSQGSLNMWTDSQLAFIICHEMAHHQLDHHMENVSWLCVEFIVTLAIFISFVRSKRSLLYVSLIWLLVKPFKLFVSYPIRRIGELEADDIGLEMVAKACMDVGEVFLFWKILQAVSPIESELLTLFTTHPSHRKRGRRMELLTEKILKIRRKAGCEAVDVFYET